MFALYAVNNECTKIGHHALDFKGTQDRLCNHASPKPFNGRMERSIVDKTGQKLHGNVYPESHDQKHGQHSTYKLHANSLFVVVTRQEYKYQCKECNTSNGPQGHVLDTTAKSKALLLGSIIVVPHGAECKKYSLRNIQKHDHRQPSSLCGDLLGRPFIVGQLGHVFVPLCFSCTVSHSIAQPKFALGVWCLVWFTKKDYFCATQKCTLYLTNWD
mmetsp:Transcript_8205/g.15200  ORF Transcript_8205/g.15200 Transcript_8205/m.15200 type:complete len:215 (+) Transcript_8205:3270-3914(+)